MKRVESPVERWAGYVILHEPLLYSHIRAIEDAQDAAAETEPSSFLSIVDENGTITKKLYWLSKLDYLRLTAILPCVVEWHLTGVDDKPTPDTFPMTPRSDSSRLIAWLWDELYKIYNGETEVPNES